MKGEEGVWGNFAEEKKEKIDQKEEDETKEVEIMVLMVQE